MSTLQDYEKKLPVLSSLEDDQIRAPHHIPVDVYVQEAENLHHWCQTDRQELTSRGLDWELVEDIPVRCGALREAESLWMAERFTREEAAREWMEASPLAYGLRDEILHQLRFAFRSDGILTEKIRTIADGSGHADMIQDLNDLCVLGKEQSEHLARINFDMSLLDQAAQVGDRMAGLLAAATGERVEANAVKKIRDQAYTHLKEAVDELYAYGQFLFRHRDDRLRGYRSRYLRRRRNQSAVPPETATVDTVVAG